MKENGNIDELLNSLLDGELTDRQRTEAQRLIAHDANVSKRLSELEKCKALVSSLPFSEAPAEMLEQIKATVEERSLPVEQREVLEHREGARQLLFRKVLTAAAMIGLVTVLAGVIYSIVAPEQGREKLIVKDWQPPVKRVEVTTGEKTIAQASLAGRVFNGRLELKTNALIAVDGFINRAIENNGLSDFISSRREEGGVKEYSLICSRGDVKLLLADLRTIWGKFASARLLVETDEGGGRILVGDVSAEQIKEIISGDSSKSYADKAKYFAVMNRVEKLMPGKEMLVAIDESRGDLLAIPKPVLTSSEPIKKATPQPQAEEMVHLTIVVAGSE